MACQNLVVMETSHVIKKLTPKCSQIIFRKSHKVFEINAGTFCRPNPPCRIGLNLDGISSETSSPCLVTKASIFRRGQSISGHVIQAKKWGLAKLSLDKWKLLCDKIKITARWNKNYLAIKWNRMLVWKFFFLALNCQPGINIAHNAHGHYGNIWPRVVANHSAHYVCTSSIIPLRSSSFTWQWSESNWWTTWLLQSIALEQTLTASKSFYMLTMGTIENSGHSQNQSDCRIRWKRLACSRF